MIIFAIVPGIVTHPHRRSPLPPLCNAPLCLALPACQSSSCSLPPPNRSLTRSCIATERCDDDDTHPDPLAPQSVMCGHDRSSSLQRVCGHDGSSSSSPPFAQLPPAMYPDDGGGVHVVTVKEGTQSRQVSDLHPSWKRRCYAHTHPPLSPLSPPPCSSCLCFFCCCCCLLPSSSSYIGPSHAPCTPHNGRAVTDRSTTHRCP